MLENRIKTTEIKDAAQAFISAGFDADKMRDLMNLVQVQTPYIQKRFWKIVDAAQAERVEA